MLPYQLPSRASLLLKLLVLLFNVHAYFTASATETDVSTTDTSWGVLSTVPVQQRLRLTGLRVPNHPDAVKWLEAHYARLLLREQDEGTTTLSVPEMGCPPRLLAAQPVPGCEAPPAAGQHVQKTNLVIVPVGDSWDPLGVNKWLSQPEAATFDVIAGYYGSEASFTCPHCLHTARLTGKPFRIVHGLAHAEFWEGVVAEGGYEYVWLADDDLIMDTRSLNSFFAIMKQYDLLLAQPSVCQGTQEVPSASNMEAAHQQAGNLLRYHTLVEIMGPAMRMDFFHSVYRHVINASHTGFGVDWLLPALLWYPRSQVAIVDAVCMVHPPGCMGGGHFQHGQGTAECARKDSAYRALAYNFTPEATADLGYSFQQEVTLGAIPDERYRPPGAKHVVVDPGELRQLAGVPSGHQQQQQDQREQQEQEDHRAVELGGGSPEGRQGGSGYRGPPGGWVWIPLALAAAAAALAAGRSARGRRQNRKQ
ncbi:hypothetical protein N2152v2_000859 [Parachlorella kessleri]